MEHRDLLNQLQSIGFSEKEASVYLTSLTLGKSSVQQIAKKSGVKRATTYVVIEKLMGEGLMSSVYEGKKQFFMAENPTRLTDMIERKRKKIADEQSEVEKIVPELKQLHQGKDGGPVVKYYVGKEGVLSMIKSALSVDSGEEIYMLYPADKIFSIFSDEERQKVRFVRQQKNIKIKSLYNSKKVILEPSNISDRIKVSDKEYPFDADIAIYGDNVRLTSLKGDLIGIVIKNKDFSNTLRSLFKLAWIGAEQK